MARRGAEAPVQLRLDVGRDVHERPALARHVLAVRRGEQAKCHRDAREAAAGAGRRDAAGRARAATRGRGRARGHIPHLPPRHPLQTPHGSTPRVECLPVFPPHVDVRCVVFSQPASETRKGKTAEGRKRRAAAQTGTTEGVLFVDTHLFPMSTSHMKIRSVLFPFSKLRRFEGIFRFHSHRFPTDGTCPARLHERRTRSPFQDSSSSSLEVERTSLELLCSAPQRSRLRPKSTDCPFPRLLGSLASPPPGPPVRAPFSVSGARTLPAIASRVARSSATSSVRRSSVPTRLKRVSCPSRRRKNIPRC